MAVAQAERDQIAMLAADTFFGEPETRLLKEISKLPQGTLIGLDTPQELHDPNTRNEWQNTRDYHYHLGGILRPYYWIPLVDFCRAQGLNVVFLANMEHAQAYAEAKIEEARIEREIDEEFGAWAVGLAPQDYPRALNRDLLHLREGMFRAGAKADFYFCYSRTGYATQIIEAAGIRFVVAEKFGGDDLAYMTQRLFQGAEGVTYQEVDIQPRGESGRRMKVLGDRPLPKNLNMQRERAIRGLRAAKEWRVTTGQPDWIGSYDHTCRPKGLFEVYKEGSTKNGKISLRIEDLIGTAYGEAAIEGGWIELIKTYDQDNSIGGFNHPLTYKGRIDDAVATGRWNAGSVGGHFVMVPGSQFPHERIYF